MGLPRSRLAGSTVLCLRDDAAARVLLLRDQRRRNALREMM